MSDQAYALGVSQCNDPNSYFTGSICACRPGYYQISGRCNQCPLASYYDGSNCIDTRTGLPTGQNVAGSQISFNVNGDIQTFGQSKSVGISVQSFAQQGTQQVINAAAVNGIIQGGLQQAGVYQQSSTTGQQGTVNLPPGAIPHNTVLQGGQTNVIESQSGSFVNQGINSATAQQIAGAVGLGNNVANVLSFNNQQNFAPSANSNAGAIPHGAYLEDGTNIADGQSQTSFSSFQSQSSYGSQNNFFDNSRGVLNQRQSSTSPNSLQYFLASIMGSSSSSSSSSSFSSNSFANDASFFFPAGMIPFGSSSLSELTQSSFFSAAGYCPVN